MLRHLVIAAWRNMAANRLLSAIAILGLSVGIAAALLMALVVRNQLSFDHFNPNYNRTYLLATRLADPTLNKPPVGCAGASCYRVPGNFAELLRLNVPEVENVSRIWRNRKGFDEFPVKLKVGNVGAWETIYWADPNVFDLLHLPVLHGDLATALSRPDGIVLPRLTAEKFFGRDDVIGQVIQLDDHPMVVRAVIQDLPPNATELETGIFASALAPASQSPVLFPATYVRLTVGASLATFTERASKLRNGINGPAVGPGFEVSIKPFRLDRINLDELINPGIRARLTVAGLAGLLVLFIALVNFVNLMTAQAGRREKEVGVRKSCGADRVALIVQFVGEALLAVVLALAFALVAGEWLTPALNAFLRTGANFDYLIDARLLAILLAAIPVLALLAGCYPAFVLSAFRPATALRRWQGATSVSIIRNLLVTLQFAILIVLVISAVVIWQQYDYATGDAMRLDTDQVLLVRAAQNPSGPAPADPQKSASCLTTFTNEVSKLPGVRDVRCSALSLLSASSSFMWGGKSQVDHSVGLYKADHGLFALYGIKPVAGSLADGSGTVINLGAAKALGFTSPQAAIGHSWIPTDSGEGFRNANGGAHSLITAVVPDFSFTPVTATAQPAVFSPWVRGALGSAIHIKLNGTMIPETLAAIDNLWVETNQSGPIDRLFLNDYVQQLYQDVRRESQFFALFAGIAIFLACVGLVGMAVSTAERRTKEVGVRKAMGATTGEVVALLLWQFAQPVLWANVIAWPLAWWLMQRWLNGFAYHVTLNLWLFAAVSTTALLIALLTVASQAVLVAQQKPVQTLRYE